MSSWSNLTVPFAWHALVAGTLVAIISGVVGPFVVGRRMSFAVHGAAELSFTGAAAGLLVGHDPLAGALLGSVVVATAFGVLGARDADRDSAIGVVLAFGLGLGFFLLEYVHGYPTEALNILFGQITGVSVGQLQILVVVAVVVLAAMAVLYRPLQFASVDPDVAEARGVRTRLLGLVFLYVLCVTVTEAAQVVGTLLVLSLAITPAAAARRLSVRTGVVVALSTLFALVAADGGLVVNLVYATTFRPSPFITFIAFGTYLLARGVSLLRPARVAA